MFDILHYPSGIAIPIPAVQCWSMIPETPSSQASASCEIQNERALVIPGTRAMRAKSYLAASSLSASGHIKVNKTNESIMIPTLVQYMCEFGIEHLLFSFTQLGRSVHCNNRHEA